MSASVVTTARKLPRESRAPSSEPAHVVLLEWTITVVSVGILVAACISDAPFLAGHAGALLVWLALVAAVDLLPVLYSDEIHMTMSLPILLAVGMTAPPAAVGIVAFLGSIDPREWKRQVALPRALFNRSQIALSSMAASAVFHGLGGNVTEWPAALGLAFLALAADAAINIALVGSAAALTTRQPIRRVINAVLQDSPLEFMVGYLSFGLLGLLLAVSYAEVGPWGPVSFALPLAVVRQMFLHRKRSSIAAAEVLAKSRMLLQLSEKVVEERRDERARIAGALHDEVLGALYKVHLMGEVLKRDLHSGQLLQLEHDVPDLLEATNHASDSLRAIVRQLRSSDLGPGGLAPTLKLLVADLRDDTTAAVSCTIDDISASGVVQLLIYQVAREALQNAVRHSQASAIEVVLRQDQDTIRLVVSDDGVGFTPRLVDRDEHFGLQLMRERTDLGRGRLHIETSPGQGTIVAASFPVTLDAE